MNKTEFKNKLAERLELPQYVSNDIIDACLEIISQSLQNGENVTLQGFGIFTPWQQTERQGRNPRTGQSCMIAPRVSVKFKPGKYLLKKLNKN